MDREKVIKGLENCKEGGSCDGCQYDINSSKCIFLLHADALALLKEHDPVKPVNVRWEMGINGGNCPKCMNWVQRSYNYCPFCGKAVKWDV